MTHLLPPHADLNLAHSSLQTALQIDPNQQPPPTPQQQQHPQPPPQVPQSASRKRRKVDQNGGESQQPAEPRRLRRSHEACARCRSKKIKCDSKHPRCTACATAGTPCHQEDRHRQTLTPRGHTERIERQLLQCEALLRRHYPNFDLNDLDTVLAREGIEIDTSDNAVSATFQFAPNSPQSGAGRGFPLRTEGPPMGGSPPRGYPYPVPPPPGQPMMPPGYHGPMPMHYPPYPPPHHMPMQGGPPPPPGYDPRGMVSPFHPLGHAHHPNLPPRPSSPHEIRGQDPLSQDMSNTQALAKTFGVASAIMQDVTIPPQDREDLAVGSSALISGRDRELGDPSMPRDSNKWISVTMRRNSVSVTPSSPAQDAAAASTVPVWLPKSRETVGIILEAYFSRLNFHRPVLLRHDFEQTLNQLYEGQPIPHDPGFICSAYLVFALGTLSELNHRVSKHENSGQPSASVGPTMKSLMPPDWPEHEEFFRFALMVKPDLRVTVSSLQALILLHWYLYTERQGRTLWRLVGSLVRLAIELGLHHDPTAQDNVFSEDECQLRIRLWSIVLVHDRGTSIQLGRPLAIAPSDSNTPRPTRGKGTEISEHFVLNAPIAEIQADIINSLYAPTRQTADSIMRHANRIIRSMIVFRKQLPDHYKWFFSGTEDWSVERRTKLVADITEDEGLTLLKIGITKILLLRALFSSKELDYAQRHRALVDAIVTSHNIIVVHNQLIRFPDIAFFVSPIPLHIAAMVILYGHMSRCDRIPPQIAIEDVWMALDMLPSFRWRWERKDLNPGHPLIAKLAEKVLDVNLHQVAPSGAPMLLSEQDWDGEHILTSPKPGHNQHTSGQSPTTPKMGPAQYPPMQSSFGPHAPVQIKGSPGSRNGDGNGVTPKMPEVPQYYFYPIYGPENGPVGGNGQVQNVNAFGFQSNQDQYMLEEKDMTISPTANTAMQIQGWPQNGPRTPANQPPPPQFAPQPQA
ncbi:fungal-specific transcription factor domain-containing protein [Dichomitus squalens]|uniref:Fungal-specific transcription factor domain-containing protein n=1 Tax=Dichomitus squalens TaxID=114155 RepID=A0A4Q9MI44_9APHY|nr:fungal-specific transcription factor domain-containing protein [Dichomitus squalens]TBU54529.1 fungal-specific transcription factor domain-containing protein [Dichomitus squalens]